MFNKIISIMTSITAASFNDYISRLSSRMKESGQFGTARNYTRAKDSFTRFLKSSQNDNAEVNESLICAYSDYLIGLGLTRNTKSFYMRILRSAYNKAVSEGLAGQTAPFRKVYTGVDTTRKRALDEKTIRKLLNLDLRKDKDSELARDLFAFSYFARGMAFVDLAFLKKKDVDGGAVNYIRKKTGQRMSVKSEPCIQKIVSKYYNAPGNYLFPLLNSDDPQKAYSEYERTLSWYNRKLRSLAARAGIHTGLTSYVARHSWATSARNHRISLSVISAGMGHTSEKTTRIYLASIENSEIDKANRKVLAAFK